VLAGKLLGRYLLGLLIFAIILILGSAFGVVWGDFGGVVLIAMLFTLASTAIGLALSTFVKSSGQAIGVRLLLTMTLAPLGGAWWPISIVPDWMQKLARISPFDYSQEAFNRLIYNGQHIQDVLPFLGVLLGFTVVFFVIGIARFRYE
jgi:ABC-2 type transport system permease protein